MSRQEALHQYELALKLGQKYYKNALIQGQYPYPQALDEILDLNFSAGQEELGIVDIPAEQIVGTRTRGRQAAFAGNFLPLAAIDSEFASKWISLCEAHLSDEGIRDPIRCFEYLGRFYVQEGNKRVSVLKSYDAPTIPGRVTRILPAQSDDPAVQMYFEFLRFYPLSKLYQIRFTRAGSYEKLQERMGFEPDHCWTLQEQRAYIALQSRFETIYRRLGGASVEGTVSDALLECLQVFSFEELRAQSGQELAKTLEAMWADVKNAAAPRPIVVSTAPEEKGQGIISKIKGIAIPDHIRCSFIYAYPADISAWTAAHVQGAKELKDTLGDQVDVLEVWAKDHDYESAMEEAIGAGTDILFATTPQMVSACRKIAAKHPKLKVLNCGLSLPYTGLRTYYSRTYEAKFITGAIAGAMAEKDQIGYIAQYPIVGVPAEINAFALGAQMTDPRAQIELVWSSETADPVGELLERGVTLISNRDAGDPKHAHWALDQGTYKLLDDGALQPLALPIWDWGRFYEQVVRSVMKGSWNDLGKSQSDHAVNYWWGMASGVIDVKLSPALPEGIRRLAEHLCADLRGGFFEPFRCRILDQSGRLCNDGSRSFTTDELMRMDWLCENVHGRIPQISDLRPEATDTAKIMSLEKDRMDGVTHREDPTGV